MPKEHSVPRDMPRDMDLKPTYSSNEPIKKVFSVDDGINEIERDIRFLEGLQEGLKFATSSKKNPHNTGTPTSGRPTSLRHKHSTATNLGESDHGGDSVTTEDPEDQNSLASVESYTLRDKQDAINETHPFGIRIWKPALYKKHRSVQKAAAQDIHETKYKNIDWKVHASNVVWSLLIGVPLFCFLSFCALLVVVFGLFTVHSLEYGLVLVKLGRYLIWPFGKVVMLVNDQQYLHEDRNEGISVQQFYSWVTSYSNKLFYHRPHSLHRSYGAVDNEQQRRLFGRGKWSLGRLAFYFILYLLVQPVLLTLAILSFLGVFTIPMSSILWNLMYHCRRHPLALEFKQLSQTPCDATDKAVLLCTFRCAGLHYYKFTVDGTNVIVMNLLAVVVFTIVDFYLLQSFFKISESAIFCLCLLSIIPLAFYIGQAVASISAQTSMGLGAVINAFFSTIVEIFLYCVALRQGKGLLVEGSMIGSIMGAVLLLPGLSMCGGALNRKTQRYNPASAGVSSAMLIFSMMVMFIPTVIYQLYGGYIMECTDLKGNKKQQCYFRQPPLKVNQLFTNVIKPMSIFCAVILFFAYIMGLWFTLRTHAAMIWQIPEKQAISGTQSTELPEEGEQAGGHDAPNWTRNKSAIILLVATLLYAIIAEILVDCVDNVLKQFPSLNPKFLGLTIFALVPNTTEFLNAISFAMHGNVALSMEIGSAYALQVCLLQVPALVLFSMLYYSHEASELISIRDQMFSMVFPSWDMLACMLSVFLFTYLYAEGKSNYFKGSILMLLYTVLTFGFFLQGSMELSTKTP
ncbi:LAMI_0G06656g1_1 [Lachancea mirantina]|uniref:LAMI_0G06656g1_1 n=1 Tax=Lachancea mirantina TaxID=1230905 RepID=A0A1G4K9A3_9SACH|nr:LAMI_0G06656g1_1 [Lachancea mirantina]